MIVDKLCARCGKLMVQVEHNRKRCPECALIVHREQARQRQRDRKEEMLQRGVQRVKKATIVLSYGAMATVSTAFGSFANIYALPTPVLLTDGSDSISCYARAIVAASGTPEPSIYNINVDFYISIAGWME